MEVSERNQLTDFEVCSVLVGHNFDPATKMFLTTDPHLLNMKALAGYICQSVVEYKQINSPIVNNFQIDSRRAQVYLGSLGVVFLCDRATKIFH